MKIVKEKGWFKKSNTQFWLYCMGAAVLAVIDIWVMYILLR